MGLTAKFFSSLLCLRTSPKSLPMTPANSCNPADPVSNPAHYTSGRKYEPIDVIEDWDMGYHISTAIAYLARAGRKNPATYAEDIGKAIFYLEREIRRCTHGKQRTGIGAGANTG